MSKCSLLSCSLGFTDSLRLYEGKGLLLHTDLGMYSQLLRLQKFQVANLLSGPEMSDSLFACVDFRENAGFRVAHDMGLNIVTFKFEIANLKVCKLKSRGK